MRKVVLYIATSLDGFIAKLDGSVDWLGEPSPDQDYGYGALLQRIDTTLMGRTTFEQVLTFGDFPYKDKENWVFSRDSYFVDNQLETDLYKNKIVKICTHDAAARVATLKAQTGKDIWLVGGGILNTTLLNAGLIDEMIISICPIILGNGIPLFSREADLKKMQLQHTESYPTGYIQMTYSIQNS